MKKILFILPSLVLGGLERELVTLANRMQSAGYSVTVMILANNRELENELNDGIKLIYKENKRPIGKSIPYIRYKFYDDDMWETRVSPATLYKYYVGREKYDVEIAFFHGFSVKILSGSTNKNAVHIAWVHNDFTKICNYRFKFKSMDEVRKAYQTFDHVVCVSEAARQGYLSVIGDTGNTVTVYNMLPVERIKQLSRAEIPFPYPGAGLRLVLVGRLRDSHKGQLRLIEVVSRLHAEGYDLSLTLVGDGDDREMIEQEILRRSAEQYIFAVGSQKNPYPFIAGADMLVCASYYEGFNLTVAEALILEVPVISTRCTGPCEILDDGKYGMLVENSAEGLYAGIKEMLDEPERLNAYRKKAAERRDFFDENRIFNQITDLIEGR